MKLNHSNLPLRFYFKEGEWSLNTILIAKTILHTPSLQIFPTFRISFRSPILLLAMKTQYQHVKHFCVGPVALLLGIREFVSTILHHRGAMVWHSQPWFIVIDRTCLTGERQETIDQENAWRLHSTLLKRNMVLPVY